MIDNIEVVEKHKKHAKESQLRYDNMKTTLGIMESLRTIPKLFRDYNLNKRNNLKMRGKE